MSNSEAALVKAERDRLRALLERLLQANTTWALRKEIQDALKQ